MLAKISRLMFVATLFIACVHARGDDFVFSANPAVQSGPPGATTQLGYTFTNNSTSLYALTLDFGIVPPPAEFLSGQAELLDPILVIPPQTTVSSPTGFAQFTWSTGTPPGFIWDGILDTGFFFIESPTGPTGGEEHFHSAPYTIF